MAISEATPGPALATRLGPRRLLGDEQLARLAAGSDTRAFEAIFARYHQELYRYCRAILGNAADAEDALQATMAAALRSLPGESRRISLRPWLYRVAHNEAISIVRRREPLAEPADLAWETVEGVEAQADSRRRLRELVADLKTLPERQRSALVMRELSGLDYEEIGSALGASGAAARQTVYEARVALGELEAGREMECHEARRAISARDGRLLRSRRLRAHLRACQGCRDFRAAIPRRRAELEAISPPLPALAATGVLASVLGGSGGAATTGGAAGAGAAAGGAAASAAAGGGAAGGGGAVGVLGASAGLKAASVVAAVAIGAGAADVTGVVKLPLVGGSGATPSRSAPASPASGAHHDPSPAAATATQDSRPGEPDEPRGSSRGQNQQAAAGGGGPGRSRAVGDDRSHGSAPAHAVRTSPGTGRAVGHARLHLTPAAPASPTPSPSTGNANGVAHRSSSSNGAGSPTKGRPSTHGSGPPAAHAPPGQTKPHTQTPPGQTKPHTQSPPGQTKPQTHAPPGQTKPDAHAPPGQTKPDTHAPSGQTRPETDALPPPPPITDDAASKANGGQGKDAAA